MYCKERTGPAAIEKGGKSAPAKIARSNYEKSAAAAFGRPKLD
jgi:hypothetical protein